MSENNDNVTTGQSDCQVNPPQPLETPQPPEPAQTPNTDKTVNTWAMACHLGAFVGLIGIPFGNILGPLVFWMIKKDEHPFIDENGKASLNFQISVSIYMLVALVLTLVIIGIPLVIGLIIFNYIFVIIASVNASKGLPTKYPLSIRFIS